MGNRRRRYARRGDADENGGGGFPWGRTLLAVVAAVVVLSAIGAAVGSSGGGAGDRAQGRAAGPAETPTRTWGEITADIIANLRGTCAPDSVLDARMCVAAAVYWEGFLLGTVYEGAEPDCWLDLHQRLAEEQIDWVRRAAEMARGGNSEAARKLADALAEGGTLDGLEGDLRYGVYCGGT